MTNSDYIKCPRLYVDHQLDEGGIFPLGSDHAHYLRNVLRMEIGDVVRVFNGRDGEWLAALQALGKRDAIAKLEKQLSLQTLPEVSVHLAFAPIKKTRMDFLIEKAVELGVTSFHPILTQNTESRALKPERMKRQIIEASEQCERLTLPTLHTATDMFACLEGELSSMTTFVCLEREDLPLLSSALQTGIHAEIAVLIGPEGGFNAEEKHRLGEMKSVQSVSLGEGILRSETACLYSLSVIRAFLSH